MSLSNARRGLKTPPRVDQRPPCEITTGVLLEEGWAEEGNAAQLGLKGLLRGEEGSHSPYSEKRDGGVVVNSRRDTEARIVEELIERVVVGTRALLDPWWLGNLTRWAVTRGLEGGRDRTSPEVLERVDDFLRDIVVVVVFDIGIGILESEAESAVDC